MIVRSILDVSKSKTKQKQKKTHHLAIKTLKKHDQFHKIIACFFLITSILIIIGGLRNKKH